MPTTATTERIEARNPATREALGSVTASDPQELAEIAAAVALVQPLWAQLRTADRARYLRRAAQAVIDDFDELAELLVRETGRPRAEVCALELVGAIDALRWLAAAASEVLAADRLDVRRAVHPLKRAQLLREPVGVVAVIGAGSAPLAQPLSQICAALVGGNGVVFKPAPRAALAGERIGRLLGRAGLPEGLIRVVHGGPAVGRALSGAPRIGRVLFSGSPPAGAEVAREAAAAGRGAVLELGAADPMIVLSDANLARAAAGALWAGCVGAGQPHGTVKRVYVARELHDRFLAELVDGAERLEVGNPLEESAQLGPLANAARRDRLHAAVEEAVAAGAVLHCGGPVQPRGLPGAFQSPTILSAADPQMRVMTERIPGPVIAVMAVATVDEAIRLANHGPGGLGASVWTTDRHHAGRIARELRAGAVWVNDHLPAPGLGNAPWGTIWRHQGRDGLRATVEAKVVTWDPPTGRSPWWYPYDRASVRAARAIAELRSVRDADRERALRGGTLALLRVASRALRGRRE
jgi:succinate-semialdehyde dehydrogenase/glutarate-semialdehyde dehydrogenase